MKKYLTYLLVLCMLLYAGGYHLAYHIYQFGLKTEMKAYILHHKESGLGKKILVATNHGIIEDSQFHWEEEGEEFTYAGEFYDVVSMSQTEKGISIICIKDKAENNLEAQMISIRKQEHDHKKTAAISQFKFQPFCQLDSKLAINIHPQKIEIGLPYFQQILPMRSTDILLPPPRC